MKVKVEFSAEVEVDRLMSGRAHEWLHARLASFLSGGISWTAMRMAGIESIHLVEYGKEKEKAA